MLGSKGSHYVKSEDFPLSPGVVNSNLLLRILYSRFLLLLSHKETDEGSMAVFSVKVLRIVYNILVATITWITSETNNRCEKNIEERSRCFVEKIEKSREKIKHTIQLKSSDEPKVSIFYF